MLTPVMAAPWVAFCAPRKLFDMAVRAVLATIAVRPEMSDIFFFKRQPHLPVRDLCKKCEIGHLGVFSQRTGVECTEGWVLTIGSLI